MGPVAYFIVQALAGAFGVPDLAMTKKLIVRSQHAVRDALFDEGFGGSQHLFGRQLG